MCICWYMWTSSYNVIIHYKLNNYWHHYPFKSLVRWYNSFRFKSDVKAICRWFMQGCSFSIVNALEILRSCTFDIFYFWHDGLCVVWLTAILKAIICAFGLPTKHAHFSKGQHSKYSMNWWHMNTNPVTKLSSYTCDIGSPRNPQIDLLEANLIVV